MLGDRATWRELLWLLFDPVVGVLIVAPPVPCYLAVTVLFWSWVWCLPVMVFFDPWWGWHGVTLRTPHRGSHRGIGGAETCLRTLFSLKRRTDGQPLLLCLNDYLFARGRAHGLMQP